MDTRERKPGLDSLPGPRRLKRIMPAFPLETLSFRSLPCFSAALLWMMGCIIGFSIPVSPLSGDYPARWGARRIEEDRRRSKC